eukprot:TRINITY_DN18623_c0_g1_i1.p1 TRINITY_DN18623_c0_g1~~TRINITY_DN18623_c0_g1_i1.p1  ORF type:complete len:391 (+),score=64.37 TRINITY_DN18623_c0_g1_i1:30-1175(+)
MAGLNTQLPDGSENVSHSLAYTKMQRSKEVCFTEGGLNLVLEQGCVSKVEEVIWKVAILLSKHLVANADLVKGKRVVELGSGIGLVGIVASALGATDSVITDVDDVLPLIENNIQITNQPCASAARLWWGNDSDIQAICCNKPPVDVLLAADVVYMQVAEDLINLAATFDALATTNTLILLAYEHRGDWIDNLVFFEEMERLNFNVTQESLERYSDTPSDEYILYTFKRSPVSKSDPTFAAVDSDGDKWVLRKGDGSESRLFLSLNGDRRPAMTSMCVYETDCLVAFLPAVVSSTRVSKFDPETVRSLTSFADSHGIPIVKCQLPSVGQEVNLRCDVEDDNFNTVAQSGDPGKVIDVTNDGQVKIEVNNEVLSLWVDVIEY